MAQKGLIGAVFSGAAQGFATGVGQNTQYGMQMNRDQMQTEINALMQERIAERNRVEKKDDYETAKADEAARYTRGRTDTLTDRALEAEKEKEQYKTKRADAEKDQGTAQKNAIGLINAKAKAELNTKTPVDHVPERVKLQITNINSDIKSLETQLKDPLLDAQTKQGIQDKLNGKIRKRDALVIGEYAAPNPAPSVLQPSQLRFGNLYGVKPPDATPPQNTQTPKRTKLPTQG